MTNNRVSFTSLAVSRIGPFSTMPDVAKLPLGKTNFYALTIDDIDDD